jgi:hypothetical protein
MTAYDADYVTSDGRLVIDDPGVRRRLIEAIDAYTAVYRKGCTPPSSIDWDSNLDNNQQFHAQAVVIVLNNTLSIPNALKRERSEDYYKNTATIEWPLGPDGEAFPIMGSFYAAWCSRTAATAKPPMSSCASSWTRAGLPTISTSPASASCRRCRSCGRGRSGSTRATPTAWPR